MRGGGYKCFGFTTLEPKLYKSKSEQNNIGFLYYILYRQGGILGQESFEPTSTISSSHRKKRYELKKGILVNFVVKKLSEKVITFCPDHNS